MILDRYTFLYIFYFLLLFIDNYYLFIYIKIVCAYMLTSYVYLSAFFSLEFG